ncbi:MAG: hypothetical protein EOP45_06520 [Sphingobacteriaceae bacterium]|nr:MAG: hypothetical protein EOP45_06520 [Sphingobacteriaceae bacterium]
MKTAFLFLFFSLAIFEMASAQKKYIDIISLQTLVENSETEYNKQNDTRDQAAVVTATETANRTILGKAKAKFVELANRYNSLGMAIDVANIGLQATPRVKNIINNQAELLKLCQGVPALSIIALQSEIEFVERANSLVDFLIGLSASAGVINQMKMTDRRILFDFAMSELNAVEYKSARLVGMVRIYNNRELMRSVNPYQNWIDQDKQIVKDIMGNYKNLHQ